MTNRTPHPPISPKLPAIWHGGDYNPEQWPRHVWDEDMALMDKAGVNVATIGVFSWVTLEPEEGKFNFSWMDDLFDLLHKSGKKVVLATPSASPPAWLSKKYPETLKAVNDRKRRLHGNRVNFCFSSPVYREKAQIIAAELSKRYGSHPALILWHISNEYGEACQCEVCQAEFVNWLKRKFDNNLEKLNDAYWNRFWGHTFTDWNQIEIPGHPYGETANHGLTIDFRRFTSDNMVDFMCGEIAAVRKHSNDIPFTTNLMGLYDGLNPWSVAKHVDVVSWDSYPEFVDHEKRWDDWVKEAFTHDLYRSLKDKPFLLIESTPSSSNWYPAMSLKPPGRLRMEGIQALSHGSDSVMYFQWRQSRGGQEKFHGAVVTHGYTDDSRVFNEVAQVGAELAKMQSIVGSAKPAEVAFIYDFESGSAINAACGPIQGDKGYTQWTLDLYRPFWEAGISTDVISADCDFSKYKVLYAPMLYSLRPGVAERLRQFVANGGTLIASFMTGWTDENDLIFEGGFLAPLRDVFGIKVEEIDGLRPETLAHITWDDKVYEAHKYCELIHPETATVLATYADRFYTGRAALTVNDYGQGKAYYIASRNDVPFCHQLFTQLNLKPTVDWPLPEGVTVQKRETNEGDILFVINFKDIPQTVQTEQGLMDLATREPSPINLQLPPFGVEVIVRNVPSPVPGGGPGRGPE